jgi:hypothetical protein
VQSPKRGNNGINALRQGEPAEALPGAPLSPTLYPHVQPFTENRDSGAGQMGFSRSIDAQSGYCYPVIDDNALPPGAQTVIMYELFPLFVRCLTPDSCQEYECVELSKVSNTRNLLGSDSVALSASQATYGMIDIHSSETKSPCAPCSVFASVFSALGM